MFLGRVQDQPQFVAERLGAIPGLWRDRVEAMHADRIGDGSTDAMRAGNVWLLDLAERIEQIRIPLNASDADLCELAKAKARDCMNIAETTHGVRPLRLKMAELVASYGITPPADDLAETCHPETGEIRTEQRGIDDAPAIRRMTSHLWWRRGLRRAQGRAIEAEAIRLGYVHKGKKGEIYASDLTVQMRQQQKRRNAAAMTNTTARNVDTGQEFTLAELAARSNANPEIRRGELMTRIAGFEAVARGLGHAGEFWTATAPSRYHPKKTNAAGQVFENKEFDGATPKEAQGYLCQVWARFRAAIHRRGLRLYGFRIAEPHHDATPHWHLLLFMPAEVVGRARALFRRCLLKREGVKAPKKAALVAAFRDAGAKSQAADALAGEAMHQWRIKERRAENADQARRKRAAEFVAIDWKRGSAAGYVAKYVSKNIDGYQVQTDLEGENLSAVTGSQRVEAWAARWGIRQFQQIGGAPVGVWRELRRMDQQEAENVEAARLAADAALWCKYTELMGGPTVKRKDVPLAVAKVAKYEEQAGQAWRGHWVPSPSLVGKAGAYGEIGTEVVGVFCRESGQAFESRRYQWAIKRGNTPRQAVARGPASAPAPAAADGFGFSGAAEIGGFQWWVGSRLFVGFEVGPASPASWSPVNNCTGVESGGVENDARGSVATEAPNRGRGERPARLDPTGAYPADFSGYGGPDGANGRNGGG